MKQVFQKIQVVRPPRHRLATFGASRINYHLVTDVPGLPDRSRLRIGMVTAEKPGIITPEILKEQFLGFGEEARAYAEWLVSHYGEALRGLEYQFRNQAVSTRIELSPPDHFVKELAKDFDRENAYYNTLIRGSDKLWELSIMKFIVEETIASFSSNFQELKDRGFFDGEGKVLKRRHEEIRNLINRAKTESQLIPVLGRKLKEYGLFDQYQDVFFQLLNR